MGHRFIAGPTESGSADAETWAEELAHGEPPTEAACIELFDHEVSLIDGDTYGDLYVVWGDDLAAFDTGAEWPKWARRYVDSEEQYRAVRQEGDDE